MNAVVVVITWSMQAGALAVTPGNLATEVRTAKYALLSSGCELRSMVPIERSAVLRARFGTFEDTVELHWTDEALDPDVFTPPFTPDEACLFGDDSGDDTDGETGSETGSDDAGGPAPASEGETRRVPGPVISGDERPANVRPSSHEA